jgi:hypothetical protein
MRTNCAPEFVSLWVLIIIHTDCDRFTHEYGGQPCVLQLGMPQKQGLEHYTQYSDFQGTGLTVREARAGL